MQALGALPCGLGQVMVQASQERTDDGPVVGAGAHHPAAGARNSPTRLGGRSAAAIAVIAGASPQPVRAPRADPNLGMVTQAGQVAVVEGVPAAPARGPLHKVLRHRRCCHGPIVSPSAAA
jgi:hypothetical protein